MLRSDPAARPASAAGPRRKEVWYHSAWNVFWVLVGALLTASAIQWTVVSITAAAMARVAMDQLEADMKKIIGSAPKAPARPAERPERYETVNVPPQSRESCLEASGGVANETYALCRRGHTYTRRVE